MNKGVSFEGLKVGDSVPPLTKEITQLGMVMYSAATWDLARSHYDIDLARGRGYTAPFADGQMLGAFLAQMLMDWIGDNGAVKEMEFQFRKMVFPGDRVTCQGRVTEKQVENGEKLVKCELWIDNQNGEKALAPASAVISFS